MILSCISVLPADCEVRSNPRIDSLMAELDTVLANRGYYLDIKERRIEGLRESLADSRDDNERFEILGRLIEEYNSFNTDSAYAFSVKREQVARRTGNADLITNAIMNRANILSAIGMYKEAMELMEPISGG